MHESRDGRHIEQLDTSVAIQIAKPGLPLVQDHLWRLAGLKRIIERPAPEFPAGPVGDNQRPEVVEELRRGTLAAAGEVQAEGHAESDQEKRRCRGRIDAEEGQAGPPAGLLQGGAAPALQLGGGG